MLLEGREALVDPRLEGRQLGRPGLGLRRELRHRLALAFHAREPAGELVDQRGHLRGSRRLQAPLGDRCRERVEASLELLVLALPCFLGVRRVGLDRLPVLLELLEPAGEHVERLPHLVDPALGRGRREDCELVHPLLERAAARLPLARREVEVDPLALDGFRQGCDLHAELRPHLLRSAGRILDNRAEPGELLAERREPQLDVGRRRSVCRSCGDGLDLEPKLKRDIVDPRADLVEATVERADLRFVAASSSFRLARRCRPACRPARRAPGRS